MRAAELDARVKLYMLLALSTASVLSRRPAALCALLALTLAALLSMGADAAGAFRKLRGAAGLIFSVFLLQCIFNRAGQPLISVGGLTLVTETGAETALCVMLRLFIILMSALIILTGQSRDYLLALGQLGLPYEVCFMVMAAMRFLPLLREEASDVLCAVQMRGTRVKGAGIVSRLRTYTGVALPIVAGAIRRSEKMAIAMEARAFRSMPSRTSIRRLKMKRSDWAFFAVFTALTALCAAINFI